MGAPPSLVHAAMVASLLFLTAPITKVQGLCQKQAPDQKAATLRQAKALNFWAVYMSSMLWGTYTTHRLPAAAPVNFVGVTSQSVFFACCMLAARTLPPELDGGDWTDGTALRFIFVAVVATVLVTGFAVTATSADAFDAVGYLAMALNVVMYGAPLAALVLILAMPVKTGSQPISKRISRQITPMLAKLLDEEVPEMCYIDFDEEEGGAEGLKAKLLNS